MPKVSNRSDDRLLQFIKQDISDASETGYMDPMRSYQTLDDGTLIVHVWSPTQISPIKTYRINISIGREMKPEEWKANVKET